MPGAQPDNRGRPRAKRRAGDFPRTGVLTNVIVAFSLFAVAAYAAYAALQIYGLGQPAEASRIDSRAEVLAARLNADADTLNAALTVTAELAARLPDRPIDSVESGLQVARGLAKAMAILGPNGLIAQSGQTAGLDWAAATRAADQRGGRVWIGAPAGTAGPVYAVRRGSAQTVVVAAIDMSPLLAGGGANDVLAIADGDGRLIALSGALAGLEQTTTLQDALGYAPEQAKAGRLRIGQIPSGTRMEVAGAPAAAGALVAVVAAPETASAAARRAMARDSIYSLLAPLLIGIGLALLLTVQSRRAEKARRAQAESEQRFRVAVEAARCGIWEWDLKTDKVTLSDVTGVMLGWGGAGVASGEEVISRIAPEHQSRVRQALDAAKTYGAFDVSFRSPRQDGRSIWIDARGQAVKGRRSGEGAKIVGVALDVTEERFAQARAQAAESRLRDAIDSVSEAFVLWDRKGRLLICNKNYRMFFNLEARVLQPGAPREAVERFVRLAIERDEPAAGERPGVTEALLHDGRWVQISERATADGGMVVTSADITAIKTQDEARRINEEALQKVVTNLEASQTELAELARKYEAAKIKAESANAAKSEFLANMSHELRTPLNAINGFSEIMVGEMFGPLGDRRYKEYSQDILSSGQHLLALINDILDMSKIEAGKMQLRFEPIQFQDIAEDAVRLMRNRAEQAGLTVNLDLPEIGEIDADYRAIKQVLLNLLSNAVKFTPRGGTVTVSASVLANVASKRLKVSVADTGIGIAPEDLARLAQPFEQIETQHAKTQQGTGLGLALSKALVEMHSGVLDMQSQPGQGTVVSFIIPFHQSPERQGVAA